LKGPNHISRESVKQKKKVATIRKLRIIEDYFADPNLTNEDKALKCLAELIMEYGIKEYSNES